MTAIPLFLALAALACDAADLPANRWVEIAKDSAGARPGSAIRFASEANAFFLWGYMNDNPDLLQEHPLMKVPEYDVVSLDLSEGRWKSHLPPLWEKGWSRRLPLAYIPRTYSGITTGSERTMMRGSTDEEEGVPRPDLNIVFDQVAYRAANNSLYFFTGGLTAVYNISGRRWTDLRPRHSPPPVLGGSLAHDPLHDELVLFGGGHVAERGPDGKVRGYTGTWVYSIAENTWRQLPLTVQPTPRMNTRMVCDTRNQTLVLFGGDSQKAYLADTWLFDLRARGWREVKAPGGVPPRAGHVTVYDPETGFVVVGGGYNRSDLADMWAFDAAGAMWRRLAGETPAGFYLSADIAPDRRTIVLVTSTRKPDDRMTCNILFPVRTTYAYRIDSSAWAVAGEPAAPQEPMLKRAPEEVAEAKQIDLASLPPNQWVLLDTPGRVAPARTWGSATFDTDRGLILYWGGGHCGYEGSDVDAYSVEKHTWRGEPAPEYPERLWNRGVRLAGVTFDGAPWTDHGRRIYAYDPVLKKLVMARPIRLTAGYEPDWIRSYPTISTAADDALVSRASSVRKYATFLYDIERQKWELAGPAPAGLDTLITTPLGVMGIDVSWPDRLNDAGYLLPWRPNDPPVDNAVYLYRASGWRRISKGQPSPQNLYEMTGLAWDSRRSRLLLHGGGAKRDELWAFDPKTGRWRNLQPAGDAPACAREAVYLPKQDAFLVYGGPNQTWIYAATDNAWRKIEIPFASGADLAANASQNRAMIYEPNRHIVFLVLGGRGDEGKASVFALKR